MEVFIGRKYFTIQPCCNSTNQEIDIVIGRYSKIQQLE